MIGKLTQIDGELVIRNGEIEGDFYNWPKVGEQVAMWGISDRTGDMRFVETARITELGKRGGGGKMKFKCKDGSVYLLQKTGEGSMIMANGGAY